VAVALPAATVAPGSSYAWDTVTAVGKGVATLRFSVAGYRDTAFTLRVDQGRLGAYLPTAISAGQVVSLYVNFNDPDGSYTRPVKDSVTFDLTTSDANVQWVDASGAPLANAQASAPAGSTSVTVYLKATGPAGSIGQLRISDPSGRFQPLVAAVTITP
jgi:hypothetical protein